MNYYEEVTKRALCVLLIVLAVLALCVLPLFLSSCSNNGQNNSEKSIVSENEKKLQAKKGWMLTNGEQVGSVYRIHVLTFLKNETVLDNCSMSSSGSRSSSQSIKQYEMIDDSLIKIAISSYGGTQIYAIKWRDENHFNLIGHDALVIFEAINDNFNPITGF